MLRFSLTKIYRFTILSIRVTAQVERFRDKVWRRRLRWFGHVQRRGSGHTGQKMLKMQQPGKRK